jgi:Pathogenicity locus
VERDLQTLDRSALLVGAEEAKERAPNAAQQSAGREPEVAQQAVSDDLTAIKGIGPAIQEKLRALGIATFSDLARADPKALTERFKGTPPIPEARGPRLDRGGSSTRESLSANAFRPVSPILRIRI